MWSRLADWVHLAAENMAFRELAFASEEFLLLSESLSQVPDVGPDNNTKYEIASASGAHVCGWLMQDQESDGHCDFTGARKQRRIMSNCASQLRDRRRFILLSSHFYWSLHMLSCSTHIKLGCLVFVMYICIHTK